MQRILITFVFVGVVLVDGKFADRFRTKERKRSQEKDASIVVAKRADGILLDLRAVVLDQ